MGYDAGNMNRLGNTATGDGGVGGGTGGALLVTINLNANGSYVIPNGNLVTTLLFLSALGQLIAIGTTPGGTELTEGINVAANVPAAFDVTIYGVGTTLFFTNITSPVTINIYMQIPNV